MNESKKNPSAFACVGYEGIGGEVCHQDGMTLLDYFAGKAIGGMMADHTAKGTTETFANSAYAVAQSMLDAREKIMKIKNAEFEEVKC